MNSMDYFKKCISQFAVGSENQTFFNLILKKIEPDLLRNSIQEKVSENSASLSESTCQYFKYHIMYNAALNALEQELQNNETRATLCKTSPEESGDKNIELFYLNLMKKYIHPDKSSSDLKFFEMNRKFLPALLERKKQQQPEFAKQFTNLVENNIRKFCIKLSEYSAKKKLHAHDWKVQFDTTVKELSKKATLLDSISINFKHQSYNLQDMLSDYYKELVEGMDLLQKLLNLYYKKVDFQLTSAILFTHQSRSLQLKMRSLELEALTATYHEDSLPALKIIREQLKVKEEAAKEEIDALDNTLLEYKILGPEFEELVQQYQFLVEKIEKKRWAIKSFEAKQGKIISKVSGT